MHKHIKGGELDYNYIDDGIYIGNNQCCSAGVNEILQKEGINADISLEDVKVDQPFGVAAYLWLPTKNHLPPAPDQLDLGVQTLKKFVEQGKNVYVHCRNGHGRATTLVTAYFIDKGMKAEEAIEFVKQRREGMHLRDSQKKALKEFSKSSL